MIHSRKIQLKISIQYFLFTHYLDSKARTPDTKNSTEEDHNQDAAPAPQLPPNIFLNPTQQCYTQFFANGKPPAGLDTINENMRYICQEVPEHPGTHFYATMFDEGRGIPLYSAYVLNANDVNFQEQPAAKWLQTKGNQFKCITKTKRVNPLLHYDVKMTQFVTKYAS